MKEMYRPALPPAAPGHDRHDPLLVAQLAAGDQLDPARAQEAQDWLATCAACAQLVGELRHVSAAVAGEPVPGRRRDFRLDPATAEQLRGNALTRFLRGLSLPRARGFAPAAAGLLSVGLVFMVAGHAWPDDSVAPPGTGAEPGVLSAPTAEAPVVRSVIDGDGLAVATPPVLEMASKAAQPEEALANLDVAEAPEGLAEHQAGSSAQRASMEQAVEAELDTSASDPADGVVASDTAGDDRLASIAGAASAEPGTLTYAPAQDTAATAAEPLDVAGVDEAAVPADATVPAGDAAAAPSADDDFERWLLMAGVALALSGATLLLLAWLARRSTDPLLG